MKDTLDEAAEKTVLDNSDMRATHSMGEFAEFAFKEGAKWQTDRMYSEEEVKAMIEKALTHNDYNFCGSLVTLQGELRTANFGVWFEENKKK